MIKKLKEYFDKLNKVYDFYYNSLLFKYKKVNFISFPRINGRLKIYKNGSIILGQHIAMNSGSKFNPIGGDTQMTFSVQKNATLKIGDYTGISNSTIVCREKVTIGNYVKIGGGCKIYDTDFHALNYLARNKSETDISVTKPIKIKDHAFIGAHSIILKGVTIGEKSIIGAGSVVTKSVPDEEIWGGNPATFIKKT